MKDRNFNYIKNLTKYKRQKTTTVHIGDVPMGGDFPIRIQSMTDTDSCNTEETVEQIIRIINAGADYVRVTVRSSKDAENLKNIKKQLVDRGYDNSLIADIHFNPKFAEIAAKYVRKVRINPGNFYDKRAKFEQHIYTDEEYKQELARIEKQFIPFIKVLKETKTALRIGANQGSLSDRIMSRYGDTPAGISESVMEFLRICKQEDYHDVVISIKSSNTRTMVYTVRMMNYKMRLEDMKYPLHLGVTEAGEGEDGRIKSAVGMGTLLADGIGDTIRVSLTEIPEKEIPVAQKIIRHFESYIDHEEINAPLFAQTNPFEYERRSVRPVMNMGAKQVPIVMADLRGRSLSEILPLRGKQIPEYFINGNEVLDLEGLPPLARHQYGQS